MGLLVHAVAGQPVSFSSSPLLFLLTVARLEQAGVSGLALETTRVVRVEATTVDEALDQLDASPDVTEHLLRTVQAQIARTPKRPLSAPPPFLAQQGRWLSLTTPLKHLVGAWTCVDEAHDLLSVNALRLGTNGVFSAGTDGAGVVAVARLAGCGPHEGGVLRLRGGGGAARSTAHAWVKAGGRVHVLEGRRPMTPPLPKSALAGPDDAAVFAIDFDGDGEGMVATKHLTPAYQNSPVQSDGSLDGPLLDGRWMLVAQHLEAWRILWAPELEAALPSIPDLMADLVAVEAVVDAR